MHVCVCVVHGGRLHALPCPSEPLPGAPPAMPAAPLACSGLPMVHRATNAVYGEVEGLVTLLGYRTQNAGCCKVGLAVWPGAAAAGCCWACGSATPHCSARSFCPPTRDAHGCVSHGLPASPCLQIILHPKWGSNVYPASLFAKAPLAAVVAAIEEAVAALRERL